MKNVKEKILNSLGYKLAKKNTEEENRIAMFKNIYLEYQNYTMIPEFVYISNLALSTSIAHINGDIYECGVWKGGMIAGIAKLLGRQRNYYLFDSFEGLPIATELDGASAKEWQQNTKGATYYDNCSAEQEFAIKVMNMANVSYTIHKGWFSNILPLFKTDTPIALLRLDGDWYDSTIECLRYLYPLVNNDGIIILDDYYAWNGCSRAVHDYLASIRSISKIYKTVDDIAYIIKKDKYEN
jgi:O-methyltransferase